MDDSRREGQVDARSAELIRQIAELTARNAALVADNAVIRRASAAKNECLANMSHELRTPLTAVLGFAEMLLLPGVQRDDRVEQARTIKRNANHLLRLLSDILDLSKIEERKMTIELLPCNARTILRDVRSLLSPMARDKGLELRIRGEELLPERTMTDATRLRQILLNLVGNALKFTQSGSVEIDVSAFGVKGRHRLRFAVTDTGIGLSEDARSRLFQRFVQGDGATTRRYGGTGLGLCIARELARLLGGDISVTSAEARGSTFTLEIDGGALEAIEESPVSAPISAPAVSKEVPVAPARLDGRTVLVAEDGKTNQLLFRGLLESAGAKVTLVADGAAAVLAARQAESAGRPFDVIFMDLQMPVLDGIEAVRQLRAGGYDRPIVALSAHAMDSYRDEAIAAGCDDLVTKPVSRMKLVTTVLDHAGDVDAGDVDAGDGRVAA